jgi:hypothetical protein
MEGLTTALLGRACRIFLELAYPGGVATVPAKKRPFCEIPADAPLERYLPPQVGPELCQPVGAAAGAKPGFAYRLGCAHFPHLKLQAVRCERGWVFSVDTHDHFFPGGLPESDPEAHAWRQLLAANRDLKERIERAWERAGLLTFHTLLREDLTGREQHG